MYVLQRAIVPSVFLRRAIQVRTAVIAYDYAASPSVLVRVSKIPFSSDSNVFPKVPCGNPNYHQMVRPVSTGPAIGRASKNGVVVNPSCASRYLAQQVSNSTYKPNFDRLPRSIRRLCVRNLHTHYVGHVKRAFHGHDPANENRVLHFAYAMMSKRSEATM